VINVNELHVLGEGREMRFEVGVVHAGTAVEDEADFLLLHGRSLGYEPGSLDVEVDLDAIDLRVHAILL
jgi:hypothetical protein